MEKTMQHDEYDESPTMLAVVEREAAIQLPGVSRQTVYEAIDTERSYQESLSGEGRVTPNKTVPEEILLLSHYVEKAKAEWSAIPTQNQAVMSSIRKIAALAVRCMENNGVVTR